MTVHHRRPVSHLWPRVLAGLLLVLFVCTANPVSAYALRAGLEGKEEAEVATALGHAPSTPTAAGAEEIQRLLVQLTMWGSSIRNEEAAEALYQLGPRAIPAMISHGSVRAVFWILYRHGPAAVPALIDALGGDNLSVQKKIGIAEVLGRLGSVAAPAVPVLISRLQDPNPGVRSATAKALGQIGPAAAPAVPVLISRLQDPGYFVAIPAWLSRLEYPGYSQPRDYSVVIAVVVALGQIGPAAAPAVPVLISLYAGARANLDLRSATAEALGRLGVAPATLAGAEERTVDELYAVFQERRFVADLSEAQALALVGRLGQEQTAPVFLTNTNPPSLVDYLEARQIPSAFNELRRKGHIIESTLFDVSLLSPEQIPSFQPSGARLPSGQVVLIDLVRGAATPAATGMEEQVQSFASLAAFQEQVGQKLSVEQAEALRQLLAQHGASISSVLDLPSVSLRVYCDPAAIHESEAIANITMWFQTSVGRMLMPGELHPMLVPYREGDVIVQPAIGVRLAGAEPYPGLYTLFIGQNNRLPPVITVFSYTNAQGQARDALFFA